jgi:hypothetical protein
MPMLIVRMMTLMAMRPPLVIEALRGGAAEEAHGRRGREQSRRRLARLCATRATHARTQGERAWPFAPPLPTRPPPMHQPELEQLSKSVAPT